MVLKLLQIGNSLPYSYIADPNATYQPGICGQLNAFGLNIVMGVSDGSCPVGIIDDIRTNAFTQPSIDEVIIVTAPSTTSNGKLVLAADIKTELEEPHVIPNSFMITGADATLNAKNGLITLPAGTPLNLDVDGDGILDSVKVICNYTFQVPGIIGDDSTTGSGRITVWFSRMICATNQFETNMRYPLNSPLFSNESGLFTTRMPFPQAPAIGLVQAPPTSISGYLELLWL